MWKARLSELEFDDRELAEILGTLEELPRRLVDPARDQADQLRGFVNDGEIRYVNVGRGKKRERMMFKPADIEEFVERRTKRKVFTCLSNLKSPHSTGTISTAEVVGFTARRNERRNAKPKK